LLTSRFHIKQAVSLLKLTTVTAVIAHLIISSYVIRTFLFGCLLLLLLLFMCRKYGSVELYRSCVKGVETGFNPLRQPSRSVTY